MLTRPPLAEFTVVPHVACLDEFTMTGPEGSFTAEINEKYLDRLIEHMNERERLTGDLSPLVIGHTTDEPQPEESAPRVVGFARNWHKGPLGETGRLAAFADFYIFNADVPTVRHFPRRSAEVWVSRYEIDPISLLGPTTPCRDLGLLRLSREGSFTFFPQGSHMPPVAPVVPDPAESGALKGIEAKLDQLLALLTESKTASCAPTPEADEMSPEEFEKLLAELEAEGEAPGGEPAPVPDERGREGEKPVKESETPPPMAEEHERLSRDNAELRIRLNRIEVERELDKIRYPIDAELVNDLAAQPTDMRSRAIARLARSAPARGGSSGMNEALRSEPARVGGRGKRLMDAADPRAEQARLIKLAREKKTDFQTELAAAGYDTN